MIFLTENIPDRLAFQVSRDFRTHTDAAALHYLFQEDEAKKKKQNPETEISHEEQKLATKFTGPTWYRKKKKKKSQLLLKLKNLLKLKTVKREPEILINCSIYIYSIGLAFYNKHAEITRAMLKYWHVL